MIIKGKPVRDFSLKLNTLFRGLGCLLLLLLLINLYKVSASLSSTALLLQQSAVPAGSGEETLMMPAEPLQPPAEALIQSAEVTTTDEDPIVELRQAALTRFANKFNFPNSVEFYSLSSNENWMFNPATVREKDNVLNLTTCGYYAAKNAMGLARERVPFIVDLVYDFLNKKYSVHGYFEDDRSRYHQFNGNKKPVELSRSRFKNKWDVNCKPLNVDKYDDILSLASVGRFVPTEEMTFKRQLNAFDENVQKTIASCIDDEVLSASVPALAERQKLCLVNAQCSVLDGMAQDKCELVKQSCADNKQSLLCQVTKDNQVAS
ncbi:hypothetical protein MD588_22675 [Photobacterium sp. SDRW27]|uniref:hypothetical protein n=1 Tax=Photobacterium obscurum TaxID=2829490 RepID=UPI0022432944|nr:hypothetical protein [Photobacterium obscurum]MCW8331607.1 hypothetical protein [Photobacterium obscurum]